MREATLTKADAAALAKAIRFQLSKDGMTGRPRKAAYREALASLRQAYTTKAIQKQVRSAKKTHR